MSEREGADRDRVDNGKCAVLVPVGASIEPECERSLRRLEHNGYEVRRVHGYAAIDQARSQMATDALADGFEELMWIDADVAFDPESVARLRRHGLPLVAGIYPKKGQRALSCHLEPGTDVVVFGAGGGLLPIRYAATGFLLTRRCVYDDIRRKLALATCNQSRGRAMVPYFLPMVLNEADAGAWYLGEDYAFCERARQAGYEVVADTTIRLGHVGRYAYSWEDAGSAPARYGDYRFCVAR